MLFSAILIGCAVQHPIQARPRVALRGFSFVPPAGERWEAIPRFKTSGAEFASRDGDNLIWVKAASFEVTTDAGDNSGKILDAAYSATLLDRVRGLGQDAQVIWSGSQAEEIAGAQCLRDQALLKNKFTYALSTSLLCSHPESPDYIVVLDYSQKWREPSSQIDDALQREAFLNSLQFGPLPELSDMVVSRGRDGRSLARRY